MSRKSRLLKRSRMVDDEDEKEDINVFLERIYLLQIKESGSIKFCYTFTDPEMLSPLMKACYENDVNYVTNAISEGVNLNSTDEEGYTALNYAAEAGSIDVLKLLLQQPLSKPKDRTETLLHTAILKCKKPEVIDILLKAGADVNAIDDCCNTPIECLFGLIVDRYLQITIDIGRILLENNDYSYCIIDFLLSKAVQSYRSFLDSQHENWLNLICMLLYYGADVNAPIINGESSFSYALQLKCDELCSILLPYVIDFNMIIKVGNAYYSYFLLAIINKSPDLFYMIEHGADINWSDGYRLSCLKSSVMHSFELFEYMFTHCNDETILSNVCFLNTCVLLHTTNAERFISCCNLFFEHKLAYELFGFGMYEFHMDFIKQCIRLDISINEQIKLLYMLLMYNNELRCCDLKRIFNYFGFDDRFEVYLRLTIVIRDLENLPLKNDFLLLYLCFPNMYQPKLKFQSFPTLKALSRDCIRMNIRHELVYVNNVAFKYYNYLMQLDVPEVVKDILTMKKLV